MKRNRLIFSVMCFVLAAMLYSCESDELLQDTNTEQQTTTPVATGFDKILPGGLLYFDINRKPQSKVASPLKLEMNTDSMVDWKSESIVGSQGKFFKRYPFKSNKQQIFVRISVMNGEKSFDTLNDCRLQSFYIIATDNNTTDKIKSEYVVTVISKTNKNEPILFPVSPQFSGFVIYTHKNGISFYSEHYIGGEIRSCIIVDPNKTNNSGVANTTDDNKTTPQKVVIYQKNGKYLESRSTSNGDGDGYDHVDYYIRDGLCTAYRNLDGGSGGPWGGGDAWRSYSYYIKPEIYVNYGSGLKGGMRREKTILNKDGNMSIPYAESKTDTMVVLPEPIYIINVTANSGGNVNGSKKFSRRYLNSASVSIIAKADNGYKFSHWGGDLAGYGSSASITIDSIKSSITADAFFLADGVAEGCSDSTKMAGDAAAEQIKNWFGCVGDGLGIFLTKVKDKTTPTETCMSMRLINGIYSNTQVKDSGLPFQAQPDVDNYTVSVMHDHPGSSDKYESMLSAADIMAAAHYSTISPVFKSLIAYQHGNRGDYFVVTIEDKKKAEVFYNKYNTLIGNGGWVGKIGMYEREIKQNSKIEDIHDLSDQTMYLYSEILKKFDSGMKISKVSADYYSKFVRYVETPNTEFENHNLILKKCIKSKY